MANFLRRGSSTRFDIWCRPKSPVGRPLTVCSRVAVCRVGQDQRGALLSSAKRRRRDDAVDAAPRRARHSKRSRQKRAAKSGYWSCNPPGSLVEPRPWRRLCRPAAHQVTRMSRATGTASGLTENRRSLAWRRLLARSTATSGSWFAAAGGGSRARDRRFRVPRRKAKMASAAPRLGGDRFHRRALPEGGLPVHNARVRPRAGGLAPRRLAVPSKTSWMSAGKRARDDGPQIGPQRPHRHHSSSEKRQPPNCRSPAAPPGRWRPSRRAPRPRSC